MEYLRLSEVCSPTVLATVLEIMPPYPEKQSALLVRLKQKKPLMEAESTTVEASPPTHTEDTPKLAVHLAQQQPQQDGLLLALDTNESYASYDTSTSYAVPVATTSQSAKKFLLKNSDIIFENDLLQIGIKSELKQHILQVEFYYGNKTNSTLSNISINVTSPGEFDPGKRTFSYLD